VKYPSPGLSFGKLRVLRRIVRRPMPMGELAALLGVDPPNMTPVVDDLERAGLVERQARPTDRRVKLAVATSAGAALAAHADEILVRPPGGMSELSAEDLTILARILSRVRRNRDAVTEAIWPGEPRSRPLRAVD
jgi:DNA-binding MarR family transcriptional regulator